MTAAAQQLLREALRLTPIEKAVLIEELFHSFDQSGDSRIDGAWAAEVESRLDAYDAGALSADPAETVLARINGR